ncbi:MAG: hypothetical protein HKP21_01090 [Xanthomonadales bacterium]|nr:hypothetical protein [Gammaproteobacteria bacterium]NNK03120.1 hypothetical protein [Xanthomonadales bacterium]NNL00041.1 hypothetical protein [Xanthomonadales bacterium]
MSRKIKKGAFELFSSPPGREKRVSFQYNPEQLTRIQNYNDGTNSISESIRFTLILHVDALPERDDPDELPVSIYPQLAALERMFEAQTVRVSATFSGMRIGRKPSVLAFTWGQRTVPIRIQRFVIKEQVFNTELEPVYATIDVQLRLMTAKELANSEIGLEMLRNFRKHRLTSAKKA